jgi:hypothetical protein
LVRVARELEQLHLVDRDAHQFKTVRHRRAVGQCVRKSGAWAKGCAWFRPAPERSGPWMELLPMLAANLVEVAGLMRPALAPQAEL